MPTDWTKRARVLLAFAEYTGNETGAAMHLLREFQAEAAAIAESAFGAGAHMKHNQVIAAAIRAMIPPEKEED